MSHHNDREHPVIDEKDMDDSSRADTLALLSLVAIVVILTVFYVSR